MVARRLITNILGVRADISPEQKQKEAQQLEDAKERKRQERQRKQEEEQKAEKFYWGDE